MRKFELLYYLFLLTFLGTETKKILDTFRKLTSFMSQPRSLLSKRFIIFCQACMIFHYLVIFFSWQYSSMFVSHTIMRINLFLEILPRWSTIHSETSSVITWYTFGLERVLWKKKEIMARRIEKIKQQKKVAHKGGEKRVTLITKARMIHTQGEEMQKKGARL